MRPWKKTKPEPPKSVYEPIKLDTTTLSVAREEGQLMDFLLYGISGTASPTLRFRELGNELWFCMESYLTHIDSPQVHYNRKLREACQRMIDYLDGRE